ncbi:MAG: ABC transporter ATP-binding protein [Clostridia bacterium]|jgi:peptide/nickel transport system ATP-binding protein
MTDQNNVLVEVKNLKTYFHLYEGTVRAVDGISFDIKKEQTLGVIGESGSGKSVTAQSILQIVPSPPGKIEEGEILLHLPDRQGVIDLAKLDPDGEELRSIRGKEISMIFQEPMRSFGPLNTIGQQIVEAIQIHNKHISKKEGREMAIELLRKVGIPKPEKRVDGYPHQFSGGMLQRAMIAMALSCSPRLLIADEPTTAVDVTIQAQLMELLSQLQEETGMSIMLITHNLAVVSEIADEIIVMYLGRIVEQASVEEIFYNPLHPYTRALWKSIPKVEGELEKLQPIEGTIPSPYEMPEGCYFYNRCEEYDPRVCDPKNCPPTVEVSPGHRVSCWKYVK